MQLFTGNTAFLPLAVIEGRASVRQLAVNWGASFVGNLAGALLAVSAIAGAGLVGNSGPAIPVALAKVQLPFSQARPTPRISLLPSASVLSGSALAKLCAIITRNANLKVGPQLLQDRGELL